MGTCDVFIQSHGPVGNATVEKVMYTKARSSFVAMVKREIIDFNLNVKQRRTVKGL